MITIKQIIMDALELHKDFIDNVSDEEDLRMLHRLEWALEPLNNPLLLQSAIINGIAPISIDEKYIKTGRSFEKTLKTYPLPVTSSFGKIFTDNTAILSHKV